jgi:hypothetical protein
METAQELRTKIRSHICITGWAVKAGSIQGYIVGRCNKCGDIVEKYPKTKKKR